MQTVKRWLIMSSYYAALCRLQATACWALTATPVHNSPKDLLALVKVVGVPGADVNFVRDMLVLRGAPAADLLPPLTVSSVLVKLEKHRRGGWRLRVAEAVAAAAMPAGRHPPVPVL